jgi:hypothetical protein
MYHYARGSKSCPRLHDFLQNKEITFTTIDMRGDGRVLDKEGFNIPIEYHVDVQDMFKTNPDPNHRDDMEKLAGMMIAKSYNRKKKCPQDIHDKWYYKPMEMSSLSYATIDAYVSYELYNRLITMRGGILLRKQILNDRLCVR